MVATRILSLLLTLLLASCSQKNSQNGDALLNRIRSSFPQIEVTGSRYLETPELFHNTHMALDTTGLLVVSDFERKVISLLDTNGTAIGRFGGEGRGPGEFSAINEILIGPENDLYVMDRAQYRISRLEISSDGLSLLETVSYANDGSLSLVDLHVMESGRYGVYGRTDDWETGKNSYQVYRLSDDYGPAEHLLTLPGYDPLHLGNGMYMADNLLSETIWDFNRNHFYYTTSKSTEIYSYHLVSGGHGVMTYLENAMRPLSDSTRAYFREAMSGLFEIFPQMDNTLETLDHLPFAERLSAYGNHWFLEVFYSGGDANIMLVINRETGATGYISVPPHFRSHGLIGKSLYGIDMVDEYRVMKLELASLPE